jgi:hypothetical protein
MERPPSKKSSSLELQKLFDSDQADRAFLQSGESNSELWNLITDNDAKRLVRAREIYDEYTKGVVDLSSEEMVQLAILFQHSLETDDYRKVVELGNAAGEDGKRIAAAGEDRWLLMQGKKQKWGTQFTHDRQQAPMLSDEESGITDEIRKDRRIPSRAEQLSDYLRRSNPDLKKF